MSFSRKAKRKETFETVNPAVTAAMKTVMKIPPPTPEMLGQLWQLTTLNGVAPWGEETMRKNIVVVEGDTIRTLTDDEIAIGRGQHVLPDDEVQQVFAELLHDMNNSDDPNIRAFADSLIN